MKSKYFGKLALRSLNRIGNIMLPANGEFPSFEEYGGLEYIDNLAEPAPADDISTLNTVLSILALLPGFVSKWVVKKCAVANDSTGALAPTFRQLNIGLRGLIFACYYSDRPGKNFTGKDPMEILEFELNKVVD